MLKKILLLILCLTLVHSDWSDSNYDYSSSSFDTSDSIERETTQNSISGTYNSLRNIWNTFQEGGGLSSVIDKVVQSAPDLSGAVNFFESKMNSFKENELKDAQKFVQENYHYIPDYLSQITEKADLSKMVETATQYAPSWDQVSEFIQSQSDRIGDISSDDIKSKFSDTVTGAKDIFDSLSKSVPLKGAGKTIKELAGYRPIIEGLLGDMTNKAKNFNYDDVEKLVRKNLDFLRKTWANFKEQTGVDDETLILLGGLAIEYAPISTKAKLVLGTCLTLIAYRDLISDSYEASHQDMKLPFNPSGFINQFANRFVSKMFFSESE